MVHSGIHLSLKSQRNSIICHDTNENGEHCVVWNKPSTEKQIAHDMWNPKCQILGHWQKNNSHQKQGNGKRY